MHLGEGTRGQEGSCNGRSWGRIMAQLKGPDMVIPWKIHLICTEAEGSPGLLAVSRAGD